MPKLEDLTYYVKINGNPYAKNALNYQVQDGNTVGLYYSGDIDRRILDKTWARFEDWTDANDVAYTSIGDLTKDLLAFLFSYSGENYFLDIAKGNIDGVSLFGFAGIDANLGTVEKTVGGLASGRYAFQTSAMAMEALSSDSDDTSAGDGARTVIIRGLDGDYNMITDTISMNGTTPVPLTKNFLRTNQSEVLTAGSVGTNVGKITIRVISGPVEQSIIAVAATLSRDAIVTVPAGFTAFLWTSSAITEKGDDALIKIYRRPFEGVFILRAALPTYQNQISRAFKIPLPIDEKTDLETTGTSNNEASSVYVTQQFELEDNSIVKMDRAGVQLLSE